LRRASRLSQRNDNEHAIEVRSQNFRCTTPTPADQLSAPIIHGFDGRDLAFDLHLNLIPDDDSATGSLLLLQTSTDRCMNALPVIQDNRVHAPAGLVHNTRTVLLIHRYT